jgi:hypothetical protein
MRKHRTSLSLEEKNAVLAMLAFVQTRALDCRSMARLLRTTSRSAGGDCCHWEDGSGLGGDVRPLRLVLGLAAG